MTTGNQEFWPLVLRQPSDGENSFHIVGQDKPMRQPLRIGMPIADHLQLCSQTRIDPRHVLS